MDFNNLKDDILNKVKSSLNDGIYMIQNKATGKYLDVNGAKTAAETCLIQYDKNANNNQKFYLTNFGDSFELTPLHAKDKAIDVSGASKNDNARVQIYPKNNTPAQRFSTSVCENDSYKILTKCTEFSKCLTVQNDSPDNSAKIIQGSTSAKTAVWTFIPMNK